jgi:hypothetical protein
MTVFVRSAVSWGSTKQLNSRRCTVSGVVKVRFDCDTLKAVDASSNSNCRDYVDINNRKVSHNNKESDDSKSINKRKNNIHVSYNCTKSNITNNITDKNKNYFNSRITHLDNKHSCKRKRSSGSSRNTSRNISTCTGSIKRNDISNSSSIPTMLRNHSEGRVRMEGEGVTVMGEEMVQVAVEEVTITSRLSNLLTSAQQAATASLASSTSMSPSSSTTTTTSSSSTAMLSIQPSTSADQWNLTEATSAETVLTASSESSSLYPLFTTTLDTTTVSSTSNDTSGKQSTL